MAREAKPILCYVTDRRSLDANQELLAILQRAVAAGVDWIQIREKDLSARELIRLGRDALTAACAGATPRTRVLINDRLDVALAIGADGVHLGEESLPAAEVAQWLRGPKKENPARPGFLIGVSCHSLEAAIAAEAGGADYLCFGPVFSTPSKAAFGPPQGISKLAEVCRRVRIPALAIGGITLENAPECLAAGAAGIAAIRLFQQSPDLAAVVARLRS